LKTTIKQLQSNFEYHFMNKYSFNLKLKNEIVQLTEQLEDVRGEISESIK